MKYISIILLLISNLSLFASSKLEKVSVQLQWLDQFQFAGYYMAKEKGFYKDVGLEVDIKKYDYGIDVVDEVINKKANFGIGRSSLIIDRSKGTNVSLLSAIFQSSPLMLLARKDSNISAIEDFRGKRVMITPDVSSAASLIAMMSQSGIQESDIKIIKHTFNLNDLIDRKTDLMASYISNEPFRLKEKNIEYKIFHPKDFGFDFYSDILFTTDEQVRNNPKETANFVNATIKGWKYAFNNIDETVDVILKKYNSQNKTKKALIFEAKELKKLAYYDSDELGHIDKNKLQRIYDIYSVMGLVKNKLNIDDINKHKHTQDFYLTLKEKEYLKQKKEISVCVRENWLPYEGIRDGEFIGISANYLKIISKKIKTPLKIKTFKNDMDVMRLLKKGECDIKPMAIPKVKKKLPYKATKPYIDDSISLVTLIEQPFIRDLNQYMDKKFVVMSQHIGLIGYIEKNFPNIQLIKVKSRKEALRMVVEEEIFGFLDKSLSSIYYIQKYYPSQLKVINQFNEADMGIGVLKSNKILFSIMEKGLASISEQQKTDIINRWITTTVEKKVDLTYMWLTISVLIVILLIIFYFMLKQNKLKKELEILNNDLESRVKKEVEISRQKDLQLFEQEKMVSMGEMIGNIAHQWRQPLSAISTSASGLKLNYELGMLKEEQIPVYMTNIIESSKFLSETINTFRDFIKEDKVVKEVILQDRIKLSINLVSATFQDKFIEIKDDIDYSKPIYITMVVGELSQVIINILNNAKDILSEKDIESSWVKLDLKQKYNRAIITIEDSGGGIPDDIISKIFDPYFTTKHQSQGTGLGLHMSYRIVTESLNGKLYVKNTKNGAKFFIELPLK